MTQENTRKRTVLITCIEKYMGMAIKEKFESLGLNVICDNSSMTSEAEANSLIKNAGNIDILVANLAEPPMTGPVQNIENEDWNKLFDSLVHPLMYLVRAVTPQMLERKSGKIIAITSAAPLKGIANNAAYCAARGAQNGFIKAVGLELARSNIQVNAILPGWHWTEMTKVMKDTPRDDEIRRKTPAGRWGTAEDLIGTAVFLSSSASDFVTGVSIPVDGGYSIAESLLYD